MDSAEQLVLLGRMRPVLREELEKTETRLTGRLTEVEAGFSSLKDDVRGLEKRLVNVERRV